MNNVGFSPPAFGVSGLCEVGDLMMEGCNYSSLYLCHACTTHTHTIFPLYDPVTYDFMFFYFLSMFMWMSSDVDVDVARY